MAESGAYAPSESDKVLEAPPPGERGLARRPWSACRSRGSPSRARWSSQGRGEDPRAQAEGREQALRSGVVSGPWFCTLVL